MSRVVSRIRTRRNSRIGALISSAPMAFARTGSAYLDGAEYASGVPRYPSQSGIVGVLVEESGTNLLTANQASIETDTTGFETAGSGVTLSRDTTTAYTGSASLKVVCDGSVSAQGFAVDEPTDKTGGATHIGQLHLKGSGTVNVWLRITYTDATAEPDILTAYTLTGNWQNCVTAARTTNAAKTIGSVKMFIRTTTAQAVTFWADALDIKAKAYATSWVPGGTTQAAESLTVQTAGLLAPQQGSVILKVYVSGNLIVPGVGGSGHTFFYHRTPDGNNTIQFDKQTTGYRLALRNANNTSTTITTANVTLAQGWYIFGGRWSATEASIWWEGVKRANTVNPANPGVLDPSAYIGVNNAGTAQLNQPIAWMALYNKALTDAEMAAATTGNLPPDFTAHLDFTSGQLKVNQGHPWGLAESLNLLLDAPTVGPK